MTRKRQSKKKAGKPRANRRLRVWAEYRDPPDVDRFVAVLVALALRRVEEEAEQKDDDDG